MEYILETAIQMDRKIAAWHHDGSTREDVQHPTIQQNCVAEDVAGSGTTTIGCHMDKNGNEGGLMKDKHILKEKN